MENLDLAFTLWFLVNSVQVTCPLYAKMFVISRKDTRIIKGKALCLEKKMLNKCEPFF